MIAGADLAAHVCRPVLHIPFEPLRSDVSWAIDGEDSDVPGDETILERSVDDRLALVEYEGDARFREEPQSYAGVMVRVLLSKHLAQQSNALIQAASDGA